MGAEHATDVAAAIAERGGAAPPRFWKFQRANLNLAKGEVEALVGAHVAIPAGTTPAGIAGILEDNEGAWPTWTVSNVLAECSLPTNYFEWTPWSGLAGVGGLSTDRANVGHKHGYTNSTTAAGGTNNFPAGRATWYSTDYGWQGLREILDCLSYKQTHSPSWSGDVYLNGIGTGISDVSWDASKAAGAAAFGLSASGGYTPKAYTQGSYTDYGFGDEVWNANAYAGLSELAVTVSTGTPLRAMAFLYAETINDPGGSLGTFDANGTGLAEDQWAYAGASATSSTSTTAAVSVGSTNLPAWCAEPTGAPSAGYSAQGYTVTDEIILLDMQYDYRTE